jgi:hypothetical protein
MPVLTRINNTLINTIPNVLPALELDCRTGTYFSKTISSNVSFTVTNVPADRVFAITLELTVVSGAVTWWTGVVWPNATVPILNTGKTHMLLFITDDGGVTWRGTFTTDYAS